MWLNKMSFKHSLLTFQTDMVIYNIDKKEIIMLFYTCYYSKSDTGRNNLNIILVRDHLEDKGFTTLSRLIRQETH